ncbi:hypothetical protein [Marinomonas primoryensis]|uniref:hypothetical protein n=1 Tax=Marinomonas primoryensis TaxID=178399 RepID=UPI0030DCB214
MKALKRSCLSIKGNEAVALFMTTGIATTDAASHSPVECPSASASRRSAPGNQTSLVSTGRVGW